MVRVHLGPPTKSNQHELVALFANNDLYQNHICSHFTNDGETFVDRQLQTIALQNLEQQLNAHPASLHLKFEKACLLAEMGRTIEAQNEYLQILSVDPTHRGSLNNLGTLLHESRYRSAARTAYTQAVACHPDDPMGHVNLANLLFEEGEMESARVHFERALELNPDHYQAHQGMSYILTQLGDEQKAMFHRKLGFQHHAITELPFRGQGTPVRLLLLVSTTSGNTPIKTILTNQIFHVFIVFVDFLDENTPLPQHDVVFNAISDADLAESSLLAAQCAIARTNAPVINSPQAILETGRVRIAERLSNIEGVITPKMAVVPRRHLASSDAIELLQKCGFELPLLLRAPGYHTGQHFERVDTPERLSRMLTEIPGDPLFVIQYIDTSAEDGLFRKYRVMMINGELYPLHVAVSKDWKVHYFTADMAKNADNRLEDAFFLENMPDVIGSRGMAALKAIQETLGLDYAGVDFGLSANGDIILFEANATMVVNPPDPDPLWTYRRKYVDNIYTAVQQMLIDPKL